MPTPPPHRDNRLLDALGMLMRSGHLAASHRKKLREVEGMLPYLLELASLGASTPTVFLDCGCGKSYLCFMLAAEARRLGVKIRIHGVDANGELVARCGDIARELGFDNMEFARSKIGNFAPAEPVNVVYSLHACDTATDDAIAKGMELRAERIACAPCCHRQVQRQLKRQGHRYFLAPIYRRFPLFGDRFAISLTDGLRALALQAGGYSVIVREFVDPTVTPKNVLLIGDRSGRGSQKAARDFWRIVEGMGIEPAIAKAMPPRL